MLKRDVVEQLKGILEYQEDNLDEYQHYNKNFAIDEMEETYKKDIKALKIAIKAVENYDYDEREKITIEVMATKAAEGDAYYYELETGDRLVIREGKIEGIYNPEEKPNEWKTAFEKLCSNIHCPDCPAQFSCPERNKVFIWKAACEKVLFEYLAEDE